MMSEIKVENMNTENTPLTVNSTNSNDFEIEDIVYESCGNKVKRFLNTENNWAIYMGFSWYGCIVLSTYFDIVPGHLYKWSGGDLMRTITAVNIMGLLLIISYTFICLSIIHDALSVHMNRIKYLILCLIIVLSQILGTYQTLFNIGLGTSIWCILFGMGFRMLTNGEGFLPLDFYIKVSIILLAVNLKKVLFIGAKGLVVAWAETSFTLFTVFLFGYYVLKMIPEEAITVAGGLSICGSSAVVSIVEVVNLQSSLSKSIIFIMSILTIPVIPLVPIVGDALKFNSTTLGVWIGGSVDSTGAVIASASLRAPEVFQAAVIIKMIQNIWIGPVTAVISIIKHRTFSLIKLWDSFPKFVLAFLVVGLITTFLPSDLSENVVNNSFIVSEWFSSMAFVLIGFGIYIPNIPKEMKENRKILLLYATGQTFDLIITAVISYVMFTVV